MLIPITAVRQPPPVWDLDVSPQMAIGNIQTQTNLVNFNYGGPEFNPAAGSPIIRANNPTGVAPICRLRDIGTVWEIGNNANRQWTEHLTAQFPHLQLPSGVLSPARERVTIWSCYLQFLNAPAGGFGRFQGVCLVPIVGTNRFTSNAGNTTGFAVGVLGNGGAGNQLSLITKRASANGPTTEIVPLVWPRALSDWTRVELVMLSATAKRAAQLSVWLDGLAVSGAVVNEADMPNIGESINSGGWVAHFGCDGSAHANMVMRVAYPRLRQGRYLPDGTELFE